MPTLYSNQTLLTLFHPMSASFPLRASRSYNLQLRKIVIASEAWRSHVHAHKNEIATPVPSKAKESHPTSQRRLLCCGPISVDE